MASVSGQLPVKSLLVSDVRILLVVGLTDCAGASRSPNRSLSRRRSRSRALAKSGSLGVELAKEAEIRCHGCKAFTGSALLRRDCLDHRNRRADRSALDEPEAGVL
ncbi:MAG: hypothetical protein QOI53_3762 [Verrucomicrobiota bacterium]|nr:hypothetical protein [Verrucomicrobiota bacterium]